MKISAIGVLGALALLATPVLGDPITDNNYHGYKAGWFPSTSTPCPKVCNAYHGALAEGEGFSAKPITRSYVCKAPVAVPNKFRGTVYGNNFNAAGRERLCMVSLPDGQTWRRDKFYCLCVFK